MNTGCVILVNGTVLSVEFAVIVVLVEPWNDCGPFEVLAASGVDIDLDCRVEYDGNADRGVEVERDTGTSSQ